MPEATVDEDRYPFWPVYDVRSSGQLPYVLAIASQSRAPKGSPQGEFRLRVLAPIALHRTASGLSDDQSLPEPVDPVELDGFGHVAMIQGWEVGRLQLAVGRLQLAALLGMTIYALVIPTGVSRPRTHGAERNGGTCFQLSLVLMSKAI